MSRPICESNHAYHYSQWTPKIDQINHMVGISTLDLSNFSDPSQRMPCGSWPCSFTLQHTYYCIWFNWSITLALIKICKLSPLIPIGGRLSTPYKLVKSGRYGLGQPPINFLRFSGPDWKQLHALVNFEKNITLAFFKASCPQISYWLHFQLINKQLIGISFRKWNHQWST